MSNPIVTIEMENGDIMKAELYPEIAPNTVNNFISLIQKGYYDGLIFHRVINGFMIQGGCPDGTGMGGPGYDIKGEFSQNGFKNDLKHTEGVLSMARAFLWFRILHTERFDSHFFHDLRSEWAVAIVGCSLCDLVDYVHALSDLAECSVCAVQMRGSLMHDEELASGGIRMHGSCHGKNALCVL